MIQTACCVLKGNMALPEEATIVQTFDVCSLGNGDLAHRSGKLAYGQFRPTDPTNTWTQWVKNYGIVNWLVDYKLDICHLDLVFDFEDPRAICESIRIAIDPIPIMPNFSDFWTWTGTSADPTKNKWSLDLGVMSPWHFVQAAYQMPLHSQSNWNSLRHSAMLRLLSGKKLVLGLYDPGRQQEMLAALLMASFQHPNLYWHYYIAIDDRHVADQINPYWSLAR